MNANKVTFRALLLGVVLAMVFAVFSIQAGSTMTGTGFQLAGTQIPIWPFLVLLALTVLINPFCRLIRVVREFSRTEILTVFIMGMIAAGIPNFGLVEQLLPVVGGLYNRQWNTEQSEWHRYVVPFINEAYFVSEPGIQEAARRHLEALEAYERAQTAYEHALRLREVRARAGEHERALEGLEAQSFATHQERARVLRQAENAARTSADLLQQTAEAWRQLQSAQGHPEAEDVLRETPDRLPALRAAVEATRAVLAELEEQAFEKVALYRRGLPRGQQAYPGIAPQPGDDTAAYFGRFQRLTRGLAALRQLRTAVELAGGHPAQEPLPAAAARAVGDRLERAAEELGTISDASRYRQRLEQYERELGMLHDRRAELVRLTEQLSEERRLATRAAQRTLDRRISRYGRELDQLEEQERTALQARQRLHTEVRVAGEIAVLAGEIAQLAGSVVEEGLPADEVRAQLQEYPARFSAVDISLRRYFVGEIPWQHWARPLGLWALLIAMSYVMMMTLNVLIFRQWMHNEKLTYPIAEIPKALMGQPEEQGRMPAIFRNGLFWIGISISGGFMGWNLLCAADVVPGLNPIQLNHAFAPYVEHSPFMILGRERIVIFFTMIGLAFLIPKNISFSLWFFYLCFMGATLVRDWSGVAVSDAVNWWYLHSFRTALGQGAMIVFSSVVFFKCRRYVFCAFMPSLVADLETAERRELRIASVLFLACSVGIIVQLSWGMGANPYHTVYFYVMILLLIIGLVRAVTEGGVLSVKIHVSPFHVIRAFFGLHTPATSVSLFVPLIIYCNTLFLDLKSFIAPIMANTLKLREDYRMRRGGYHLAVALAILASVLAATLASMILSYDRGADGMNQWFYSRLPANALIGRVSLMVKDAPAASPDSRLWVGVGAGVTGALLFLRQYLFWMPHPLGLIMLVSPLMRFYWFSVLLGWMFNSAVTKYASKEVYQRSRGLFIGLIVGELLIAFCALFITLITGVSPGREFSLDLF